jgi:chloramphenicol-sensitive protein RarD
LTTLSEQPLQRGGSGLIPGIATYTLWGFLPLMFYLLKDVGAATAVAHRTIWSLVFVAILMLVARRMGEIRAAFRDRRSVLTMALAALILGGNWLFYVYAVETGQVLEASFGYFILPLVNVAMGVVFLRERLSRGEAIAIGIAAVAIAIQAVGLGHFPLIAIALAVSFAIYGYLRKTATVGSAAGLFVETLLLSPLAVGFLLVSAAMNGGWGLQAEPGHLLLLLLTGPATAVPLLLFAYAVQRLRLTTMGMLQYIAPSIALVLAVTLFGETLNPTRLLSFGLIWLSLVVFTLDGVRRRRIAAEPV